MSKDFDGGRLQMGGAGRKEEAKERSRRAELTSVWRNSLSVATEPRCRGYIHIHEFVIYWSNF